MALALLARPFAAYNRLLERSPLKTKSITSGFMSGLGDIISQRGEHHQKTKTATQEEKDKTPFKVDWKRTGVMFVFGTFVAGPMYHYWFGALDQLPIKALKLRQYKQRAEVVRAFYTLKKHGIEVPSFNFDKLPSARPFHKYTEKAMKIGADQLVFSSVFLVIVFMGLGLGNGAADKILADRQALAFAQVEEVIQHRLVAQQQQQQQEEEQQQQQQQQQVKAVGSSTSTAITSFPSSSSASASAAPTAVTSSSTAINVPLKRGTGAKQTAKLEKDLEILKQQLTVTKGANSAEAVQIEAVLQLLREEKSKKTTLSWKGIWDDSWHHCKEVFWPSYAMDCLVWPLIQLVNFSYVPLRLQVLFVNVCNLGWYTFLSFMANKSH